MSEYIKQFKIQLASKVRGVTFQDRGANVTSVLMGGSVRAVVKDEGDYVVVTIDNKDFKYDKWYTKPQHLADTIAVYLSTKK
ncbi:hypothetical protein TCELL_0583 [Thermogladius calderae 1633]|uniref:Uncharacterized protein n=1 Tax=Thermogladius calderae (strain DSM 22663 / VKM B-2946 / 1633) TaxID=1184251 RepID=I3TE20_THEC1|nr:hypothetical protein [Thermogladius calderae]AFK51008.1 hypothetical protein TCELL_0583 [Thermogladius calderae 1633]